MDETRIAGARSGAPGRRFAWGAVAAGMLAVGFVALFAAPTLGKPAVRQFALLMREDDDAWAKLAPEEQKSLLARYGAWVGELEAKGILRGGEPFKKGGRLLRMVDGAVVDSPFAETKQVLTGFFIIECASLEEAVAIGKGCPALTHGESLEVREVGH